VASSAPESAAPDPIELVLGFANTHDHIGRVPDRFGDVEALRNWLAKHLSDDGGSAPDVTPTDVVEAREIRDALVTVLLLHADDTLATEEELASAEGALQRAAHRYPLLARISRSGAGLSSAQPGLAGVLGSVFASVVGLSQSGQWDRLKACRNCHHAFLDQTRNRSAGYCRVQCSSQAGMRAYRSRQRERRTES
jgi:predicted RNA-binding Zn ribbon-like protein